MTSAEKREHAMLIAVNVAIIVAAETIGGGSYFFETRLIEGVALLFTILPLVRVFTNYRVYDPTIVRVIQTSLVALVIFTESQAIAYAGRRFFGLSDDVIQALVANLFIGGLLTIVIGAEMVLNKISKRPKVFIWVPTLCFLGLVALTMLYSMGIYRPSLDSASQLPLAYALTVACVAALGFMSFSSLRKRMPVLSGFVGYFIVGAALVAASAITSFFAVVLSQAFAWPAAQIAYAGAFSFFAAISLMFLAFGKLKSFGGIYKDLQEEKADR